MFGNTIAKRVKAVMEQRIKAAEEAYKSGCEEIDREATDKKNTLADEKVREILGE